MVQVVKDFIRTRRRRLRYVINGAVKFYGEGADRRVQEAVRETLADITFAREFFRTIRPLPMGL
jgi:hypothetical protein